VRVAIGALLAVLLAVGPAGAAEPSKGAAAVAEARRRVLVELRYAEAIAILERALLDPDLPVPKRVEAYELLARALIARGELGRAQAAFDSLLEIDPGHALSESVSPKIRDVFLRARSARPQLEPVRTATAAPPPPEPSPESSHADTENSQPVGMMDTQPPANQDEAAWYERWWVWAIVGAVAVGGVSAVLLSRRSSDPTGTLDPIHLP
jgi:tetratricopeptide (TPR) repeat protein